MAGGPPEPGAVLRARGISARLGAVVCAALAAGCATVGPPPPPPVSAPDIEVEPAESALTVEGQLLPPAHEAVVDELLASPMLRDPDFQEEVEEWIDYWAEAARPWVPDFLRRMGHFEQSIDSVLAERGLPPSLRYLPFIESGYNPRATSHASAVGMWQFMAPTARGFGMEVSPLVDERRSPVKSTEAAIGYLERLHGEFDSWFLALAAYNGGPTRTRRILARQAPLAERSDSLFWALRRHFPRETQDFVPKLVGAVMVASAPDRHGYEPVEPGAPFVFDAVAVPDATTLDVVARAAESSEAEIARLNPELVRGITPPGRRYELRVPRGRAGLFALNYARIPPDERVTFVEHTVASGETLSHIARRYGISVIDLEAANPSVRPRYLQIGETITVPVAPSARRAAGR